MTRPGTSRRAVLRAAATSAVVATSGCAAGGGRTEVAVVWSGGELAQFRRVLDTYQRSSGRSVEVIGVGDDIDAFLRARHRAGTTPDVAILSRPGLVAEYARQGWLSALDERFADPFPQAWSRLLRVDGKLYGAWVKAAQESLFWYLPSVVGAPPSTWEDLVRLVRDLGTGGADRPAPLSVGAADGWVLTAWFANVLAALAPAGFYEALAHGQAGWEESPVRDALDLLAGIWSLPGAFPGGGRRALLTQFEESVINVTRRRAAVLFEADFVESVVTRFQAPGGEAPGTFRFPEVRGKRPLAVGGDAAVVMRGSGTGEHLVEWLTRPEAFATWIDAGGYLSPNREVPVQRYPSALRRQLAGEIRDENVQFDLSDQLPGTFGGADGVGSWRILQNFFASVTTRGTDLAGAVAGTTRQLARAARDAERGR